MRQTPLNLSEEDRSVIEEIRSKGLHQAREVNRAHVLSCLDRGIPGAQIMAVLGIGRAAVWRGKRIVSVTAHWRKVDFVAFIDGLLQHSRKPSLKF